MLLAAEELDFEKAAELRDQVEQLSRGDRIHPSNPAKPRRFR